MANHQSPSITDVSEPPAQDHILPDHEAGVQMESTVSDQEVQSGEPRAPEHLCPQSQGSQESSPATTVCLVAADDNDDRDDHDDGRRAVVSSPQVSSESRTEDVKAEESVSTLQSDGLGQDSREGTSTKVDATDDQQAQRPESSGLDVPELASPVPAMPDSQREQDNRPPTLSPAIPNSQREQDNRLPVKQQTRLPATPEFQPPTFFDPYGKRPVNDWTGILPHPNQTLRLEKNTKVHRRVSGRLRIVRGPTNPLGPPMKPFDAAMYEDEAQRMWMS